jgi:hypothetical protein
LHRRPSFAHAKLGSQARSELSFPGRTLIPGVISDTLTSLMVVEIWVYRGDIAT